MFIYVSLMYIYITCRVYAWYRQYMSIYGHLPYITASRGLTLEDPDLYANTTIIAGAALYFTYELRVYLDPSIFLSDTLFKIADTVYLVNALAYLIGCLRDLGWFWFLPTCFTYTRIDIYCYFYWNICCHTSNTDYQPISIRNEDHTLLNEHEFLCEENTFSPLPSSNNSSLSVSNSSNENHQFYNNDTNNNNSNNNKSDISYNN